MEDNMNKKTNNNGGSPPPPPHPLMCECGCHREAAFPPGYKFNPTDEELVVDYLKKKVMNEPLPYNQIMHRKIVEVNLYRHNPENLAEEYKLGPGEREWYFFTPRDRKYRNGNRPNRAAGDGYWKATGADKAVRSNEVIVGYRKALVFYKGKPPKGDKTNWIMHEYRFNAPARKRKSLVDMRLDDWVLCRIYKKNESTKSKSKEEEEENPDVTGEQSVEAAAFDENQNVNNGDNNEQLTETGDNNVDQRLMNNRDVEEEHQHTPPTFNPYGSMYQTLPIRQFQGGGGSLVNTPLMINNPHLPQFYEDQQYYNPQENENNYGLQQQHPPPPQMVPSVYISHPSMYSQMKANPRLMFRVKQLRHSLDSKPRGLIPQYYPHQRQQHPHPHQIRQQHPHPPQQEQQAQSHEHQEEDSLSQYYDENSYLEAVKGYNSDFSSDDQNKPPGSAHDPSFDPPDFCS